MKFINKNIVIAVFITAVAPLCFLAFLENVYASKIYPNVKVAGIKLSGLRQESAEKLLEKKINDALGEKIVFTYEDKKIEAGFQEIGLLISPRENASLAYQVAHKKKFFTDLKEEIKSVLFGYDLELSYFLDKEKMNDYLSEKIEIENKVADASLKFFVNESGEINFKLEPAKNGLMISKNSLNEDLDLKIKNLSSEPIVLKFINGYPEVKNQEIKKAREQALAIIKNELKLKYKDKSWEVEPEKIASWLNFVAVKEPENLSNKILGVKANQEEIKKYLESLAPQINQEPVNAELTIKDGKAAVFALSQDGIKLSIDKNLEKLSQAINAEIAETGSQNSAETGSRQSLEIVLETEITEAEITTESIDNLGITSLIGQGTSNFAGSPKNRIHNIKIGAATFHGVLIKPGEEFSFNKILGVIGPQKGYLPELVIRQNRTVPEYGGGLCQVSTTCFRAALYSGLPITEREPHAYAVKYYNPQGLDATIYPPHPDLRFINDTPSYILIQTKVEGNELIFDFYGADDGRKVEIEGPYTYDKKSSGAMKAVVHREIYRNEELVKKESFYSSYNSPALYPRRSPLE